MSARILTCNPSEYFRDEEPDQMPALSQSIATTLLTKSPLHAWSEHPRLGGVPRESTEATNQGTVVHKLLLGRGQELVIVKAKDFRTKLAQEQRDQALAEGCVPILEHKFAEIAATAEILRAKLADHGVTFTGDSEVPIEWFEDGNEGPVRCRCMIDHLQLDRGVIFDVKKAASANPLVLSRSVVSYGYDIQHAAYCSAVAKLSPPLSGRIDMRFVFVELEPPFDVWPARLDGVLREHGRMRWERAIKLWERCLLEHRWPGYSERGDTLEAPAWVMAQELGNAYGEL